MEINKKMTFREILMKNPNAAETLLKHGLHCVGCPVAQMETLEMGCKAHGMNAKDIDALVKELNKTKSKK